MARPRKATVFDLCRHGISYHNTFTGRHWPTGERVTVFVCDRLTQDQAEAIGWYTNTYIARVHPEYAPEITYSAVILAEHTRAWRTARTRE